MVEKVSGEKNSLVSKVPDVKKTVWCKASSDVKVL